MPASHLNFRSASDSSKNEGKGRKLLPEPASVKQVFIMMIVHICRKVLFVDTKLKIVIYLASLFLVSLIADVIPIPKTYFSETNNIFNKYFVKMGWAWTLAVTSPFVILTSFTYCCGNKQKVYGHILRLLIGTFMWFFWTKLFAWIESSYGKCIGRGPVVQTKCACLERGYLWNGFDISGHAFILIHSSLTIVEEARAIYGWEGIKDLIRKEEHNRTTDEDDEFDRSPLKSLSSLEFSNLKEFYNKFTPYVRALIIAMTCLVMLWDIMLLSTIIYFHIMVEKFISGAIAIIVWFVTYCWWYPSHKYPPPLPGEGGCFRYKELARSKESVSGVTPNTSARKRTLAAPANGRGQFPRFMGMPLYGLQNKIPEGKDKIANPSVPDSENLT